MEIEINLEDIREHLDKKDLSDVAGKLEKECIVVKKKSGKVIVIASKDDFEEFIKEKRWQARDDYFGGQENPSDLHELVELIEEKVEKD